MARYVLIICRIGNISKGAEMIGVFVLRILAGVLVVFLVKWGTLVYMDKEQE